MRTDGSGDLGRAPDGQRHKGRPCRDPAHGRAGRVYPPCDVLIRAIGQDIETSHFEEAGVPVQRGKIITRSTGDFENMPGVFAGGDCASGPASVIKAIAAAKVAAANIDEHLGFRHEISCDVEIPDANLEDRTPCGRVNLTGRRPASGSMILKA